MFIGDLGTKIQKFSFRNSSMFITLFYKLFNARCISYPNKLNALTKETKQFSSPQVLG